MANPADLIFHFFQQDILHDMLPVFMQFFLIAFIPVVILLYVIIRRRKEVDYRPGIKAGTIAFATIFAVHIILENLFVLVYSKEIYYYSILINSLGGVFIAGTFWGLVYVCFYKRIPGSSSLAKSYVLGLFQYIIPIIYGVVVLVENFASYSIYDLIEIYFIPFVQWVVYYLILAFQLGYLYERFRKKMKKKKNEDGVIEFNPRKFKAKPEELQISSM